jgi:hypothetical protein
MKETVGRLRVHAQRAIDRRGSRVARDRIARIPEMPRHVKRASKRAEEDAGRGHWSILPPAVHCSIRAERLRRKSFVLGTSLSKEGWRNNTAMHYNLVMISRRVRWSIRRPS